MTSRPHVPAALLACFFLASAVAACAGDDIEGAPPTGGGAAGTGAKGGAAGSTAGAAGKAGAGAAGSAGSSSGSGGATAGAAGAGGAAGVAGAAGSTLGGSGGASGAAAGNAGQAGAAGGPSCDPTVEPTGDGKKPLFAAKDGNDTNDGSSAAPKKLTGALAEIAANPTTPYHLYIAEGVYDGAVVLPDVEGLVVEGGYKRSGTWTRSCDATARDLVVLTASTAGDNEPVVLAKDLNKGVSLIRLTVKTKDQGKKGDIGKTGETLIGISVKGAGSKLALDDVAIVVGKGGDGGEGVPGGAPPVATCDGLTDCQDGGKGEDGKDGAAAPDGTFGENGWTAGVGATGTAGGKGENGKKGADGADASCATSCPVVLPQDQAQCKTKSPDMTATVAAGAGSCGCGESSRQPGGGAASGGAALGIVVGAGAKLTTNAGRVATLGGGTGPDGAVPGPSVPATTGAKGEDAICVASTGSTCAYDTVGAKCSPAGTNVALAGGDPGTKGGPSGLSGKGGPGAGGQSFAIVKIGNAVVEFKSEPAYQVGPGGKSGTTGAAAKSGNVGPLVNHLNLYPLVTPMRTLTASFPRRLLAGLTTSGVAALLVTACSGDEFTAPSGQSGAAGSGAGAAAGNAGSSGAAGKLAGGGASGAAGASGGQGGAAGASGGGAGAAGAAGGAGTTGGAGTAGAAGSAGSGPPPGSCSESSPKFRCIGTQVLQQCNVSKKLYETFRTCGATEQCNAQTQTCDLCKAGEPEAGGKCANENAQRVCAADGKSYTEVKTCPAGAAICKDNVCQGCKVAADCPAPAGVCQQAACIDSKCGVANLQKGPPQTPPPVTGCVTKVCDGSGALVDDFVAPGTTCGTNKRCDGTGACLPCLPAPGATLGSSDAACADGLLCSSDDVSSDTEALFVAPAPTGAESNAGTAASPLTLGAAWSKLAADSSKRRVYLQQGSYPGSQIATGIAQDVVIEGGFKLETDGTWRRDCGAGAFQTTQIDQSNVTGTALSWQGTGALEIRSLGIRSVVGSAGSFGVSAASSTALMVRAASKLRLVAVVLEAGPAQAGSKGTNGYTPTSPSATTCTAGTGLPGEPGAAAAPQGEGDSFSVGGFVPGKGFAGSRGTAGGNGRAATTTERARTQYVDRCPSSVPPDKSCDKFDDYPSTFALPQGYIGCGGEPGFPGEAGSQGGGSFGLYAGEVPEVEILASLVSAQTAGAGGPGGAGAPGAKGTTPTQAPAPATSYLIVGGTCLPNGAGGNGTLCKRSLTGSVTHSDLPVSGGQGADGGLAPPGSSGRGGPVVAVVSKKSATVTTSTSSTLLAADPAPGGQTLGEPAAAAGLLKQTHSY